MKKLFILLGLVFTSTLAFAENKISFTKFVGLYTVQKILAYSDKSPNYKMVSISARHLSLGENVIALETYSEDLGEGHYILLSFLE